MRPRDDREDPSGNEPAGQAGTGGDSEGGPRGDEERGRGAVRDGGAEPERGAVRDHGAEREGGAVRDRGAERESGAVRDRGAEPELVRVSGVIADGVRGADPAEVPGKLCGVAVELLPVTAASVSLRTDGMPVQLSASSELAAHVSDLQATLGEGPCTTAAELDAPVLVTDLESGRDADRWPVFAQQASAAGVRAVYSIPLGNDTVCVGTLDLYRDVPGELSLREMRIAHFVANVMTMALTALPRGGEDGTPWLDGLAAPHDEVYQAVGMIMVQLGVGSDDALARLRAHAFADDRTVLDVAHDVVRNHERFDRD